MLLQWLDASAPRFGRAAARLPKALDPDNCGAGTNRKFLGRLAPRSSTFDLRNHSLPHLPRIGLWHRPASQKRINADSLSHPRPHENPPDSIGAEHALVFKGVVTTIVNRWLTDLVQLSYISHQYGLWCSFARCSIVFLAASECSIIEIPQRNRSPANQGVLPFWLETLEAPTAPASNS